MLSALFLLLVYRPDAGHGFIKDDFTWVMSASRLGPRLWTALFSDFTGTFYRPVILMTFAIDRALYGLQPWGYSLTNLLLLIACALSACLLLRQLGLSMPAALAASSIWLVNPHGINMSVLWLSGRTSLVMTLFSCGATTAFVRGFTSARIAVPWVACGMLLLLGAMLSKEDALLVPVIAMTAIWARGASVRRLGFCAAVSGATTGLYFALRIPSHALTAASAPAFYRLTWEPLQILANVFGYVDRAGTIFVAALVLMLVAQGRPRAVDGASRRILVLAGVWFVAGVAITARVPVRSSLYAVFPSVGTAIAFAALADALPAERRARGQYAVIALLTAAVCATPVYRSRNQRWVRSADISRLTVAALQTSRPRLPPAGRVVFEDEPVRFANFSDALGEGATDAVRLVAGDAFDAVIVPAGAGAVNSEVVRFVLSGGEVREATNVPARPPQ